MKYSEEWDRVLKKLDLNKRFGYDISYNELYEFSSLDVNIHKLKLSESVSSRFTSIEVAIKMIGDRKIDNLFYYPNSNKEEVDCQIITSLNTKMFKHTTTAPVFVWTKREKNYNSTLLLNCDKDLVIKYPITLIEISCQIMKMDSPEMETKMIYNEQELLEVLDEILYEI